MLFADRYELTGELGAGGVGVVYSAVDHACNTPVALKLLRAELAADEKQSLRFQREFRAVRRLEHAGCVRVFDEGSARFEGSERRYFTMELVEGGDLGQLRCAAPALLIDALAQVAGALAYVHSRQIVHRDLKPSNILLTRGTPGRPKLADFGLARIQNDGGPTLTGSGAPLGSLHYMSPEQVTGGVIDSRSDLYALGCIIFELWTGHPPFGGNGTGAWQVMRAHVESPAPALRSVAPDAPEALAALCDGLLRKSPEHRPQTAHEVVQTLHALRDSATEAQPAPAPEAAAQVFVLRPPLVGRESTLQQCVEALEAALQPSSNAPPLLLLTGSAGMGKSAVLAAIAAELEDRSVEVHRCGTEEAGDFPLGPFQLLEAQLYGAGVADVDTLDGVPDAPRFEADVLRRGRARNLAERLRGQVVLIDDLHLARPDALAFLDELLREARDASPGLAVLATQRPVAQPLRTGGTRTQQLQLGPLESREIREVLAAMLGTDVARLEAELIELCEGRSEGNPLLLQACLRSLLSENELHRHGGRWGLREEAEHSGSTPALQTLLTARLDAAGPAARSLLRAAAVIGREFDLDLLAQALEQAPAALLDGIDMALRAGVLHSSTGPAHLVVLRFEHARYVELLYDELEVTSRRELHGRVAAALEQRPSTPRVELAHHYARSDDDARAFELLRAAGLEALRDNHNLAAEENLTAALARLDALPGFRAETRAELYEALGDAHYRSGDAERAVACLERSLDAGDPPLVLARRHRKRGESLVRANRVRDGLEAMSHALRYAGDTSAQHGLRIGLRIAREVVLNIIGPLLPPLSAAARARLDERARLHRGLHFMLRWVDMPRAVLHSIAYHRLARRLGDPYFLIEAFTTQHIVLALFGLHRRSGRLRERAAEMARELRDEPGLSRLHLLASTTGVFGMMTLEASFDHLDQGIRIATRAGDRHVECMGYVARGWLAIAFERYALAREDFDRAIELSTQINAGWLEADAGVGRCWYFLSQNRLEEAVAHSHRVDALAQEMGMPCFQATAHEARAAVAFLERDFAGAQAQSEQAIALLIEHRLVNSISPTIHFAHSEALLWRVDTEGPQAVPDLLRLLRRNLKNTKRLLGRVPLFHGFLHVHGGAIAARRGKRARAEALFERALAAVEDAPRHYGAWVVQRVAVERFRLGAPKAELERLSALGYSYLVEGRDVGLMHFGDYVRAHVGVELNPAPAPEDAA